MICVICHKLLHNNFLFGYSHNACAAEWLGESEAAAGLRRSGACLFYYLMSYIQCVLYLTATHRSSWSVCCFCSACKQLVSVWTCRVCVEYLRVSSLRAARTRSVTLRCWRTSGRFCPSSLWPWAGVQRHVCTLRHLYAGIRTHPPPRPLRRRCPSSSGRYSTRRRSWPLWATRSWPLETRTETRECASTPISQTNTTANQKHAWAEPLWKRCTRDERLESNTQTLISIIKSRDR